MRLPFTLWLSLFSPGVFSLNYYLEGHLASISVDDVKDLNRESFLLIEDKIRLNLELVLGEVLTVFYVDKFEIHGEGRPTATAIFQAYLTSAQKRDEILKKVEATPFLSLFYLLQIEQLPEKPQLPGYAADDAVDFCNNGGILLPNQTCACPPFYTGASCTQVECLKQGISQLGPCSCPPGVYSMNCEPRSCLPTMQNTLDNTQKTFILVVNTKATQAYVLNYLFTNIGPILDQMNANSSTAYFNYIVTTYIFYNSANGTQEYIKPNYFSNSYDMVNYLLGTVFIQDGTDLQPTNRAIFVAQSLSPKMKASSNIFVFTDSLDNEQDANNFVLSSTTTENFLILKTIEWRNKIVYLISQQKGTPLAITDSNYNYRRIAQSTLGEIISFDMTEIPMILSNFTSVYQNVETIDAWYGNNGNVSFSLRTEDPQQTAWILVTVEPCGSFPTVTISGSSVSTLSKGSRFTLFSATSDTNPTVTITTSGSPWSAKVFINSLNTIYLSYAPDSQVDVGDAYVPADISTIAVAFQMNVAGRLQMTWQDVQTRSNLVTFPSFNSRNCTFNLYSAPTNSCTPGAFLQAVTINLAGSINRVYPGYCVSLDSHDSPPFVCLNGGSNVSPTGCSCPPNLSGNHCEIPTCKNGGSTNPFPGNGLGLCSCPFGYSGDFCENLFCEASSPDTFDNTVRSFGLVMQTSMSQSQVAGSIKQGLDVMLNMMTGSDSFQSLSLTTFNAPLQNGNNITTYSTNLYPNAVDFKIAVGNISYKATAATSLDSFSALYAAMTQTATPRSSIFLFVDAPPSGTLNEMDIARFAINLEFEISIIISPPYNMPELCLQDISPYLTIAQKTGGVIYNLCSDFTPNGQDPIVGFFQGYGASHHHTENIAEYMSPTCRTTSTIFFFVDNANTDVYLIVNSQSTQNFSITYLNNDDGGNYNLSPITNTPFLAIYGIPLNALNTKGYTVNIRDGPNTVYGGCYSRIITKSTVAVYLAFSDNPSQDSQTKTLTYTTAVYPVVHISTPLGLEGSVNIDSLDTNGDMHYFSVDQKRNYTCRYESYFQDPLICDSVYGTFILNIKTAPPVGGVIQRSRRTLCYLGDSTCLNGGIFENGRCSCPAGKYSGHYCEYPTCANGAVRQDYECLCGPTRSGKLCEFEVCSSWNYMENADPREMDFNQITFVISTNLEQLLTNQYISGWIEQFVRDIHNGRPKLFSLLTFDDQVIIDVASTSDRDTFVQIVQNTIRGAGRNATTTLSLDAINEAFKININPPSIIYLFTGTDASRTTAVNSLVRQRIGTQVNIIYTPEHEQYPGQPGGTYGAYLSIVARQSGGRIWPLTQNRLIALEHPLSMTVLENALVFDDAQADCSQGTTFSFILDSLFQTVYFDISGRDITVMVYNQNGTRVPVTSTNVLLTDSALLLLSFDASSSNPGGIWTVTITTNSGSCYLQVRTVSPVRVVPGFTSDQNSDFVKELPFLHYGSNKTSYMTFRLVDRGDQDMSTVLNTMDISSGDYDRPWSGRQALQTVNIRPRTQPGCASQYVTDLWTLNTTYNLQKFVVYGSDSIGGQFQRTFFYSFGPRDQAAACVFGTRSVYGECICDSQHTGDSCQQRICQNGGTQSYLICVCPNGFYGDYCEKFVTNGTVSTATITPLTGTSSITTPGKISTPVITPTGSTTLSTTQSGGVTTAAAVSTASVATQTVTVTMGTTSTIITFPSSSMMSPGTTTTGFSTQSTATTATAAVTTTRTTGTTRPTPSTPSTPAPLCDPYGTIFVVSLFLDATNILPDVGSGTYFQKEQPIVIALAKKLDLGFGDSQFGDSRFVFNGVSSKYSYCGNVTEQANIPDEANCMDNGIDSVFDLELALQGYLTLNYWPLGAHEKPAIGVIFSATQPLDGVNGSTYYINQLQSKNYTFLGVDVSTDGSLMTPLTTLVGAANVYKADGVDSTSTWLRNRICQIKPS